MALIRAIATFRRRGEMNQTEEKYSRHLQDRLLVGEIRWWSFASCKFRIADKCWYTPDFLVVSKDLGLEAHEVKSYWKKAQRAGWEEDARVKVKACADIFPIRFLAATLMPDHSWQFEEFGNATP